MRIICPNCDAQYEVPTSVIPADGRDVECSNCGQTWYQHHPDHMPEADADAVQEGGGASEADPGAGTEAPQTAQDTPPQVPPDAPGPDAQPEPTSAPRRRRELDPGVASILREEAAREKAARRAEPLEMQTDLNLGPAEPARSAPDLAPRPAPKPKPAPKPIGRGSDPLRETASRRELLPDIEEINSTLRSAGDRDAAGSDPAADAPLKTRQKRSFRRGFSLSMALFALAALLYSFAPDLGQALPQAAPALDSYTAAVDAARLWLNEQVTALTAWLETQAAASQR